MSRNSDNQKKTIKNSHETLMSSSIQILLTGGYYEEKYYSDILLLDYNEKTWKEVSIKLPYLASGHGSVILNDQLYIIGGYNAGSKSFCTTLYRLNNMRWEKLADMQRKRSGITNSCVVLNGCIWVIGGWPDCPDQSNTVEKYDPKKNEWENMPKMKISRPFASAAGFGDKIYVCGGNNESLSLSIFDVKSKKWTDFYHIMPEPRMSMPIVVDETSIICIGGYLHGEKAENTVWQKRFEDLENESKPWLCLPQLCNGRGESSAVRIETGHILVFGGLLIRNNEVQNSCSVEIFDGQKWENLMLLPKPLRSHTTVVLTPSMIDDFQPILQNKTHSPNQTPSSIFSSAP